MHYAQVLISRGSQIRAARALLDWSVADLASATGLHRNSVSAWEAKARITRRQHHREHSAPNRILRAFAEAGVTFIREPTPGVCFVPAEPRPAHGADLGGFHAATH